MLTFLNFLNINYVSLIIYAFISSSDINRPRDVIFVVLYQIDISSTYKYYSLILKLKKIKTP